MKTYSLIFYVYYKLKICLENLQPPIQEEYLITVRTSSPQIFKLYKKPKNSKNLQFDPNNVAVFIIYRKLKTIS